MLFLCGGIKIAKRIVIAGSRNYTNYEEAKAYIDFCISDIRKNNEIIIISDGCRGADAIGERYAKENDFKIERYPAQWKKYSRGAGPRRNKQMAEIGDYVICFWDKKSKGTASMISYAQSCGKIVKIKYIS